MNLPEPPCRTAGDWFSDALEAAPAQRSELLAGLRARDPALCAEVESLLAAHAAAGSFLATPLTASLIMHDEPAEEDRLLGACIDAYQLVELVGRGGMGTVYRAIRVDREFDRTVAIKVLNKDCAGRLRVRFQKERQVLAGLDHPNIARLLDGGATADGQPYLVMEFVDGLPVDRYCEKARLGLRDRLELFAFVCDAVDYAHRSLVVHRDLKPRNILVNADGRPKLLDFGIAKLLDDTSPAGSDITLTLAPALTPRYASPEQVRAERITTASDVYSLGVVLYELLTGRSPYELRGATYLDAVRAVCESEPAPPSSVCADDSMARRLRGDLDTIVLASLHKDAGKRYPSAQQLADDIRRHLSGMPVRARRSTRAYRAAKFVKRNQALVGVTLLAGICLVGGLAATWASTLRARKAEIRATTERDLAVRAQSESAAVTSFLESILSAANPYGRGRELPITELLEEASQRIPSELIDRPGVEAGVRLAIARTYAGLWEWEKAAPHARRSLELYESLLGRDHEHVAGCLSVLGRALTFARDPTCIELQRRALEIRTRKFGPASTPVAETLGNFGFALWHALEPPDYERAESYYRRSLRLYHELGIHDHPDVARLTFSMGMMLLHAGRPADAEPHFRNADQIYRTLPSPHDRYRLACLHGYALALDRLGRSLEADSLRLELAGMTPPGVTLLRPPPP